MKDPSRPPSWFTYPRGEINLMIDWGRSATEEHPHVPSCASWVARCAAADEDVVFDAITKRHETDTEFLRMVRDHGFDLYGLGRLDYGSVTMDANPPAAARAARRFFHSPAGRSVPVHVKVFRDGADEEAASKALYGRTFPDSDGLRRLFYTSNVPPSVPHRALSIHFWRRSLRDAARRAS